jgi:hypothetical protein
MIARSRVTITLPTILREQAQMVAAERGDSVSDVVRLALQQYLERTRKEREGLTALYAEFADEDRQLAEAGLQTYADILAEEEASHKTRAADTLVAWQQVYAGLTDTDVSEVEALALDRTLFAGVVQR